MSARGSLALLAAVAAFVAGGVWLSATIDRRPKVSEAVAAAIRADLAWYIEGATEQVASKGPAPEIVTICLQSDEPLDYALLADRLAGTFIRAVPVADCKSKTVEGDFGMFSAMTYWFDENGARADMRAVERVLCSTPRRCVVDINSLGAGNTYEVRRLHKGWKVTKTWQRWIV